MVEHQIRFDDGAAYERMMGTWSRFAGEIFLDWVAPRPGLGWIDVGCGNGAFMELLVERCAPIEVQGIDPSDAQLAFARARPTARVAKFQQGDAMALPDFLIVGAPKTGTTALHVALARLCERPTGDGGSTSAAPPPGRSTGASKCWKPLIPRACRAQEGGACYPATGSYALGGTPTKDWNVFEWRGKSELIPLVPGTHKLLIVVDQHWFNWDSVRIKYEGDSAWQWCTVWKTY